MITIFADIHDFYLKHLTSITFKFDIIILVVGVKYTFTYT